MTFHSTSICVLLCLMAVGVYSVSSCGLEPEPDEGKNWILQLKTELFKDANIDLYAYWLTYDQGFRVLRTYKGTPGLYIVDFREDVLDVFSMLLIGTPDEIPPVHRIIVDLGVRNIRRNARVEFFDRRTVWAHFCNTDSPNITRRATINPPVGSNIESTDDLVAKFAIKFVETEEEKERCFGSCVDVTDPIRPKDFDEAVPDRDDIVKALQTMSA